MLTPFAALSLQNNNLELQTQFYQDKRYIPENTVSAAYHKKIIRLKPSIEYEILNFKKIKLNQQLSYLCVATQNVSSQNEIFNTKVEERSNSSSCNLLSFPVQAGLKTDRQERRVVRNKRCGYREQKSQQTNSYHNLKKIIPNDSTDVEIQQLKNSEKSEFMQLFMQFYDPTTFLIDAKQLFSLSRNQEINQQNLKITENQCSKPRFSFRDYVNIKFKDMQDDEGVRVRKALKNLFYLYLNGDYRGLNDNFSLRDAESENWEKTISNRYVSYKYKSKHINFDYCPKKTEEASNDSPIRRDFEDDNNNENDRINRNEKEQSNNKKQVIYNKSKYVMQFLLKLLDKEHLNFLEIPEGFLNKIQSIQENIKETSKKNKLSQSQFYNHTHFDCLFLQITQLNENYIQSSDELLKMHCSVFDVADVVDSYTVNSINFFKELITQIVMQQIDLIRNQIIPQLAVHTLSFKSSSKLKYFERICDSIEKLKEGYIISKF